MKGLIPAVLLGMTVALSINVGECFADDGDAAEEASTAADTGAEAVTYTYSGDDEAASEAAGQVFDTAGSSPPPVYLDCGDNCTVDPADLKQYDPPSVPLEPSYVPPLLPSE
jgi:hypothetical protein